ncbi:MAG TPA: NUDIX domain-containing protein [Dehalococcoidia bacterium]|nr:NUDIX domain-containing protein [Dehalococcoidia bacterium]
MPSKSSAGLLLYRRRNGVLEVLLAHPGGPFWAKKDQGAWSIPKGEIDAGEDPLQAAIREFEEETGHRPSGDFVPLSDVRQAGGKVVFAWAVEGDLDAATIKSNTFSVEWPPRSGRVVEFPEIDRVAWFSIEEASNRILKGQLPLLSELVRAVAGASPD